MNNALVRNSDTDPIRIDSVQPDGGWGLIGMSFCPGKKQRNVRTGHWPSTHSSKRTLFCSRTLIHHQSQFLRAPTVLFASERGQGRAAFFAARRSKPLTPRRGEHAGEWLCAQQFRAHNHDDKALIPRLPIKAPPLHFGVLRALQSINRGAAQIRAELTKSEREKFTGSELRVRKNFLLR